MSEFRLGLAIGSRGAAAAAIGPDGRLHARAGCAPDGRDMVDVAAELLDSLAGNLRLSRAGRVVVATSALTAGVHRPEQCARVGVLRIGAPACNAVPPFTRWPTALAAAVRGPIDMVRGGHSYDGRAAADLDVAAVTAFGRRCRGVVSSVAVTAVHAQANRAHEERAALLLADLLGPGAAIVTGGEEGGLGLLERENTAVLDAALVPVARTRVEAIAAALEARGMPDELYLMRGDGTVFPAQAAAGRPLRTLGALRSAAHVGEAHRLGEVDRPRESGRLLEVRGVRTNLREFRCAPRTADAEHVAAIGAAVAEAGASIDRIFWLGRRGRAEVIEEARQLAREAAIRAGADPRRLRPPVVHEALMTYVPASCIRIRAHAAGPVVSLEGSETP